MSCQHYRDTSCLPWKKETSANVWWKNPGIYSDFFPCPGTTCLVALLSDKELTVANVGDSRGVLCDKDGNAIPLSHDHKPYQLKERKRIKKAGEKESTLSLSFSLKKKLWGTSEVRLLS